jgi:hypothetical protein
MRRSEALPPKPHEHEIRTLNRAPKYLSIYPIHSLRTFRGLLQGQGTIRRLRRASVRHVYAQLPEYGIQRHECELLLPRLKLC